MTKWTKQTCQYCGAPIVYGDERNMWLGYHGAWYHRLYWTIRNKVTPNPPTEKEIK